MWTVLCLEAETEYFKSKFDYKVNSVKKLWNNLNSVCSASRRVSKNFSVNNLNINGHKLEDKSDICNAFNEYFVSVGDDLVKKICPILEQKLLKVT